jgi:catechol 2,3-dioxygenase
MDLKEQTSAPAETERGTGSYAGNPGLEAGVAPFERAPRPIEAGVDIGHVHLKAADLARIKAFYVGILGFDVMVEAPTMLFVAAGGYHHHIGFNTWESKGGSPPPPGSTGLYHVAIRYPTRAGLGDALRRLRDAGYPIDGFNDHGTHEAIYLRDPEQNGLELCWDRPVEEWDRDAEGHYALGNRRLDLAGLLRAGLEETR